MIKDTYFEIKVPFPPSVNHYWGHGRGRVWVSDKGKAYRIIVVTIVKYHHIPRIDGLLEVNVALYPPDKRVRDADNYCKGLLDALKYAGIYKDDSLIKRL